MDYARWNTDLISDAGKDFVFFNNGIVYSTSNNIIIIFLKEVDSARMRESDLHLISPKTPATQYQAIDRKKRKGKTVEDKKG